MKHRELGQTLQHKVWGNIACPLCIICAEKRFCSNYLLVLEFPGELVINDLGSCSALGNHFLGNVLSQS